MTIPNTPPPDELAQVRADIKRLSKREEELKALLLAHPDVRTGAAWAAEVKTIETTRVDLKELKAMHGDLVAEYTFPQKITRIELLGVTEDGELISARQMRAVQAGDTQ